MKHLYLPQNLSKQLKDKGFNEECLAWWFEDTSLSVPTETRGMWSDWNIYANGITRISAPFYQQVIDWFREKHNWNIEVSYRNSFKDYTGILYPIFPNSKQISTESSNDYYEALTKAIEEAIKLI